VRISLFLPITEEPLLCCYNALKINIIDQTMLGFLPDTNKDWLIDWLNECSRVGADPGFAKGEGADHGECGMRACSGAWVQSLQQVLGGRAPFRGRAPAGGRDGG